MFFKRFLPLGPLAPLRRLGQAENTITRLEKIFQTKLVGLDLQGTDQRLSVDLWPQINKLTTRRRWLTRSVVLISFQNNARWYPQQQTW